MRDGRPKKIARVMKETSNLPAPLVMSDVGSGVGCKVTVLTRKTVLLASCLVVGTVFWSERLETSDVEDDSETVDVVVDVSWVSEAEVDVELDIVRT